MLFYILILHDLKKNDPILKNSIRQKQCRCRKRKRTRELSTSSL